MNAGQILSAVAVLMVLGTAVAVSVADPGDNTIVAEEKWNNTDIVENVFPDYTECALEDNFYAYVLNGAYAGLSGCEDAAAAKNKFNASTPTYKFLLETDKDIDDVLNYYSKLTGPDAGIVGLYRSSILDAGSDADMALVETYVNEVMEMDTESEFEDFVRTGGSGNFRSAFTSKAVWNSQFTGDTTLMVSEGTLPWSVSSGSSEEGAAKNLANYKNVLDAYFADEPAVAEAYYDDLVYASDLLHEATTSKFVGKSYSGICGMCDSYPMADDMYVYRAAGLDDYTVTNRGYIEALDSICAEGGYRYSRAIAMYAVLYDSAYRMGSDYVKLITGGDLGGSGIIYDHDKDGSDYGMLIGKYYTQLHVEPYRGIMDESVASVIEAAKGYYCSLEWIGGETKERIVEKISKLVVRNCGPEGDQWDQYDYSAAAGATCLVDLTSQMRAINEAIFLEQCQQNRGEFWPIMMLPQTYNAFYSPSDNSINILAGYVIPRIEASTSPEMLCGLAFTAVGHEITHGFDSNGANYDGDGLYDPGWMFSDSERREFDGRIYDLIDYLDGIAVADGESHSGKITNREVTADMGGMAIVLHMAKDIEGFDYDEFFRAYSVTFTRLYTHDDYVSDVMADGHPSGLYRTNIVLMQFQEFFDCYGIEEGDNMYLSESVNPWRVG